MFSSLLRAVPAVLFFATGAQAHPHVFVDVRLSFEADAAGRISAVEVTWSYDELFSLLILSDRAMDTDADMALTEAEQADLIGFDLMNWPDWFNGALFIESEAGPVELGPPEALSIALEEGRLVTRHRRAAPPVESDRLVVKPYDPSFYAQLRMAGAPDLPEGCASETIPPDDASVTLNMQRLGDPTDETLFEEAMVGVYYADTVVITCGAR
ncbi:MAG: DUF1007 family protein [Roseovarius sp.]